MGRRTQATLCRCGQSKNKPLCDGSHTAAQFKGKPLTKDV
jgi:CDGSH-type Zn-finger protein